MGARRSNDDAQRDLRVRVAELEARVRWLERRLKQVSGARPVPPPARPKGPRRPRCPGCFAEVPRGQRDRHCIYCGFSFEVVAPYKPSRVR